MTQGSHRFRNRFLVLLLVVFGCSPVTSPPTQSQESAPDALPLVPEVTIKELMEKTITPATNTIWSYYEPPAEERDWVLLEEAAVTMLAAVSLNAAGGTGPMDNDWVQDPRWKAFNLVMLQASRDALDAIRARDHNALLAASDVMYPPCEGCHVQFNPGVINAQ